MKSDKSDLEIKEVSEKKVWEDFVLKQQYTSPFLSWNWVEFERNMGSRFETLGVFQRSELVGLLPIKSVDAKRGKYLHLRHGPVFDFTNIQLFNYAIECLRQKARNEKRAFVRISPLIPENEELPFDKLRAGELRDSAMHDVDAELTWVLDLEKSEEEIFAGMRKNTRYYIKRAEKDGVTIIKTQDSKYLEEFWNIYSDTVKRQQWSAYSKEYITKEFEAFTKDDRANLFLAKYKEKFIAGAIFLYFGDQSVYHHSGSLTKYSKIPASYLLQWESIKEAKNRGLKWYNFWGIAPLEKLSKDEATDSNNPSAQLRTGEQTKKIKVVPQKGHPWEGLSFFKLGFGGQKREFIHAKDIPVNWKYYLTRMFETIERKRRGY